MGAPNLQHLRDIQDWLKIDRRKGLLDEKEREREREKEKEDEKRR